MYVISNLDTTVNQIHKYVMTYFPVRYKPTIELSHIPLAYEYHNVLSKELCGDIIDIAVNYDGWHRGVSKSDSVEASFTATLLHDLAHPVYEILDNLWKQFIEDNGFDIDFVEYYEVKEYKVGDKFGLHVDNHGRIGESFDRKFNLILQLSDSTEYEGGNLHIIKHHATRKLGSAIFFPAHYPHYVTAITSGTRYSLIGHSWGTKHIK